jgi:hypothetical protein
MTAALLLVAGLWGAGLVVIVYALRLAGAEHRELDTLERMWALSERSEAR